MRVRDVMSRNVLTVEGSESCHEAAARMFRSRIRHLPVVDREGRLAGVVTDRDLRHRLLAPAVLQQTGAPAEISVETLLKSVPVSEIMTTRVVTAKPEDELGDVVQTMIGDKVGSLPVVDNGRVVGIVTETDILRQIVRAAECCCDDVPAVVVSFP